MVQADYEQLGLVLVRSQHYFEALAMVVLGVQLFMLIYSFMLYMESEITKRQRRLPYIAFNFVVFALSAARTLIASQAQFITEFHSQSGMDVISNASELGSGLATGNIICTCVVIVLSDAMMFYRCYIVRYSDALWLRGLPALFFIPSTGFAALTITQYTKPNRAIVGWPEPTFLFLTVAFNILVTFLIAQGLIRKRKELQAALPSRDMRIYTGGTAIVIESAVPLTITGVGAAIVDAMSIKGGGNAYVGTVLLNLFNLLYTCFNQLSPMLIVFRVTAGRSWTNNFNKTVAAGSVSSEGNGLGIPRFRHTHQRSEGLNPNDTLLGREASNGEG